MQKKTAFVIIGVLLMLFASGCVKNCLPDDYDSYQVYFTAPTEGDVISYNSIPTFSWNNNLGCKPQKFRLIVSGAGGYKSFDIDGDETEFSSAEYLEILQPHREMEASIYAYDRTENSSSLETIGANTIHFWTDGLCEANELVPPILYRPENGVWKNLNTYWLSWVYPGDCVPEFFKYEMAADPDFTNMISAGITDEFYYRDEPITNGNEVLGRITARHHTTVPECARIYWRVEARKGNQSGGYSETFRFTNAADFSCWQNQESIDAALIRGRVFEDACLLTKPWIPTNGPPIIAPCLTSKFGIHGDGNQSRGFEGDPGIPDVTVELGAGACPSTGLEEFQSMSNGMYYFMVQSPGEYCVSVSKLTNPNLENGIWTEPLTDEVTTQKTITFGPGEMSKSQNFGWDGNNYIQIEVTLESLTTCRAGWSTKYPEVMFLEKGSVVPLIARNDENNWHLTRFGCWIYTGEDPGELPAGLELPPPPEPQPADQPKDDGKKDCSEFTDPVDCPSDRCTWVYGTGPGRCVEK